MAAAANLPANATSERTQGLHVPIANLNTTQIHAVNRPTRGQLYPRGNR
jgi:hypothetical protein